tara:strand:+ start:8300 stop:8893 length:594 start_codon:yes stop_codon:yes gene_type:complete
MLFFILLSIFGCAAELDVKDTTEEGFVEEVEEVENTPPQFGIIQAEDCDQMFIGSDVCNMVLYDHNEDIWQLHDHKGKVILLDFSTVWCGPCQNAGHYAQPLQDEYGEDFLFVTILVDGATGDPPIKEEVDEWVSVHNITTSPVLYGDRTLLDQTGETGYRIGGFPTYVFIDKNLKIHVGTVGFNNLYIRSVIEELL